MTVSSSLRRAGPFLGNGVTTSFPFTFKVFSASDIELTFTDSDGNESVLSTNYSIALNADQDNDPGGTITYPISGSPLAADEVLVGLGAIAYTQTTDITNTGRFLPQVIENALDRNVMHSQQLAEAQARVVSFPASDPAAPSTLPALAARAGNYLAFDADGDPVAATGTGADAGLRTDLAASSGASLTGFIQSGAGAGNRSLQTKARERVTCDDYEAAGDNATNDDTHIAAAIAAKGWRGGALFLLGKTYRTSGAVTFTLPIQFQGEGGLYSGINPAGAGAGVATLNFSPNPAYDHTLTSVQKMALGDPSNGTRAGGLGVFLNTLSANQNLPKFTMRDMQIGQGSTWGFEHINDPALNTGGGMYCGLLENNAIKGGVHLDSSGDSNRVVGNVISGTGIGVSASLVTGASLLSVEANNITTANGTFLLDRGPRFIFNNNNCENSAPGTAASNDAAMVNVRGNNGVAYAGQVVGNLISAFGSSDATTLLRLKNARGTFVGYNTFLSDIVGVTPIVVESDCKDVVIGPNTYRNNFTVGAQVSDAGEGTMGVVKTATLQNGWVAFAVGTATIKYMKSMDGMVHVWGAIKNGTTTNGTIVATLPVGFRPGEIIRGPMFFQAAGTPGMAEFSIDTDGQIHITYVTASDQVEMNFTFPAANLANAVSFE